MNLAKYAKQMGLDYGQYRELKDMVRESAERFKEKALEIHNHTGHGMYYPTHEVIEINGELDYYILDHMKTIGFKFINNNEEYRIED